MTATPTLSTPDMPDDIMTKDANEMPDKVFVYNDRFGLRLNEEPSVEADIFKTTTYTRTQPDQPSDESRARAFHFENGKHADIVKRLRGVVRVPITDGLGPVEGQDDYFERVFPGTIAANEAADYIEELRNLLTAQKPQVSPVQETGSSAEVVDLEKIRQDMRWIMDIGANCHPNGWHKVDQMIDYLSARFDLTPKQPRGGE